MEYAKDDVFHVEYNTKKIGIKSGGWKNNIKHKIRSHKLLTTIVIAFIIFSTINIIMIYNFLNILQKI